MFRNKGCKVRTPAVHEGIEKVRDQNMGSGRSFSMKLREYYPEVAELPPSGRTNFLEAA